jgi:glycogen synthase
VKVLTVARWYPSHDSPGSGSFVRDLVLATVGAGVDARVVSFDRVLVQGARPEQRDKIRAKARAAYDRVATPDALFVTPPSLAAPGVLVARIPLVRRPGAGNSTELLDDHLDALRPFMQRLVGQWRPDVIHAHTGLPDGIVAAAIGREHAIPVVVTEHASTIETVLADPLAVERYRALLEPDVLLLVVSPPMASRLAALLGVQPAAIGVLPNPVSTGDFPAVDSHGREADTLLWVGSLGEHKDVDVLLRAVAHLRTSRPRLRLRLVGGERRVDDRLRLEGLARELGIEESVDFAGWLDRPGVAAAMSRAAVFVHPSPSETFGVVAAEAILTGLPVATRRSGGVPWIVDRSGGFGAVVERDDPGSFAAAIQGVLDGPLPVDAAVARARLTDEFSAEVVAQKAVAHYEGVLDRLHSSAALPAPRPTPGDVVAPSAASASPARLPGPLPTVLLATGRDQAFRHVQHLPVDLRRRLVLVVPQTVGGAASDGLRSDGLRELGVRLVEVDLTPIPAAAPVPSRGLGRLRRADRTPPKKPRVPLASAVLKVAAGLRLDGAPVKVVAIDAPAAALVARLNPAKVRLAAGSLRWLADCWDAQGGGPVAEDSPSHSAPYDAKDYWSRLHARQELSAVGQSALPDDLNVWLYRVLERNVRRFVARRGVLDEVDAAFDVGVGSGYWVRVWHDLGVPRVDGCDLVPDAVARVAATFGARGDAFVTADVSSIDSGLPDRQYGFVSVMNVLLHVTDDDSFRQALANVARLVRPGGFLLLVEPVLLDPAYGRDVRPEQHSRARPLAAYGDPLLAAGLELITLRGAVALANNPIEARSPAAYRRYQRWWAWVARTAKTEPNRIRRLGTLIVILDRAALLAGAAPSSKILLLRRP